MVSKGEEKFYSHGTIFDANGSRFLIKRINSVENASLSDSLRFFQPMKKVEPEVESLGKIDLSAFKELVLAHIRRHSKYWVKKDLIADLEVSILSMSSFTDIIYYLK